ncbi:MAG: DNA-formamidopyrimidine glycosylase family protein [Actinomycetota bacterium]
MPELPEMQALSERLNDLLHGSALRSIDLLQFSALKTFAPAPEDVAGSLLAGVGRRGKFLVFDLGGPRVLIHLSQGGRIDIEDPPKTTRSKMGVGRVRFEGRPSVLVKEFGTERKAGIWILAEGDDGPLAGLGPEPGSPGFAELMATGTDGRRIHTLLRDQRMVAGIGRGFADDILHHASLSPYDSLKSLSSAERERVVQAVDEVLAEALERERARTGGLPAKLGGRFAVHGRHGEPCPRCGETLRRVSYESHEVTYCPACQTDGKVLADRRLSRLLK